MAFNLTVGPEAEQDLSEAFRWHEKQSKGLGHDFLLQVDTSFTFLEWTPLVCPESYRGIHRHRIQPFPYNFFIWWTEIM
jgi:hypothetical protein